MTSKPTSTSFAILGLLGIQPWTAYELVAQVQRNMYIVWPRSEAHLYAELKRIVERGHATAEVVEGRRRQRTCYTITPEGRAALEEWLGTEPAPPLLEIEGILRLFLADQGTKDDLRTALEATARQAAELGARGNAVVSALLDTGGQFPGRMHLTERVSAFYAQYLFLLIDWCEETLDEIQTWPDTRDVGLTPAARKRLSRLVEEGQSLSARLER
jgi:PadR family transcriptional regulator, regulatory protein AphA